MNQKTARRHLRAAMRQDLTVRLTLGLAWICGASLHADCNGNGVADTQDVAALTSEDCNGNGVPDECELERLELRLDPATARVPRFPRAVCTGDVNGDGDLDLVTGNQSTDRSSTISVLANDGSGTFDVVSFDVAEGLVDLVMLDLDGDADLDIATAHQTFVSVWTNAGDGTFGGRSDFLVRGAVGAVAAGDLDGDGFAELVAADRETAQLLILENAGAGVFTESVAIALEADPVAVKLADLDADGWLDAAIAHGTSGRVSNLMNSGDGTFAAAVVLESGVPSVMRLVAGDFDGDAGVDLAVSSSTTLGMFQNQGDGSYAAALVLVVPSGVDSTGLGDLDRDGDQDIVLGFRGDDAVVVVRADGSFRGGAGGFRTAVESHGGVPSARALATGDFNDDGALDIALAGLASVRIVRGGERDASALQFAVERFVVGAAPHRLTSGDLDGDGDLDVLTGNSEGGVSVFRNRGDGTFPPPTTYSSDADNLAVVDVDLDGDLDVASVDGGDGGGSTLRMRRNDGAGALGEPVDYAVGAGPWQVASGDLDGDGFPDLITTNRAANSLSLRFNDRTGRLGAREDIRVGSGPVASTAVDLDRDGRTDIAVANAGSADVWVLWGAGRPAFTQHVYPLLASPTAMVAADLDSDGLPDLVAAAEGARSVNVLWQTELADRAQRFGVPSGYPVNGAPGAVSVIDMDGDGASDVVTAQPNSGSVAVLFNQGGRTFVASRPFPMARQPRSLGSGDLDGDGDADLFTANRGSGDLGVLLNAASLSVVPFLAGVCTESEFASLAAAGGDSGETRVVKYFVSAGQPNPDVAPAVFQNTRRFGAHEDFLREIFADRYGDLTGAEYDALVGRRATRGLYAGTVLRRDTDSGVQYTFTVIADTGVDAREVLELAEIAEVYTALAGVFQLGPLAYEPDTLASRTASAAWQDPPFDIFTAGDPVDPGDGDPTASPTFRLEIPPGTVLCAVFPKDTPGRSARVEYDSKSRVHLLAGEIVLSTDQDVFPAELFTEIVFGPAEERAAVAGPGEFRVLRLPAGDGVTLYRFRYTQPFQVAAGTLEIQLFGLDFRARGEDPLVERLLLDERYATFDLNLQATLDGDPLVTYSSCDYELLARWEVEVVLEDGGRIDLVERFQPTLNELDTGPAALVSGAVRLGNQTRRVDDYWRLVYAARRHNRDVVYWILLNEPLAVTGQEELAHAVEVIAPELRSDVAAGVALLGADLTPIASLTVSAFTKKQVASDESQSFRRGDFDADGALSLRDALLLLDYLFRRGVSPSCQKAIDINDDGRVNLLDPVVFLAQTFRGGPLPAEPRSCGLDATEDALGCERFDLCP